jgi:hypothetical protein
MDRASPADIVIDPIDLYAEVAGGSVIILPCTMLNGFSGGRMDLSVGSRHELCQRQGPLLCALPSSTASPLHGCFLLAAQSVSLA